VPMLRSALTSAERLGLHNAQATSSLQLGTALFCLAELDEAQVLVTRSIAALEGQGNRLMNGAAHLYLAMILLARGDVIEAERHALAAIGDLGEVWMARAAAEATLARVRIARGATGDALDAARAGMVALTKGGERTSRKGLVRLVLAEALHAAGNLDEAAAVLRDARARILARANELDEHLRGDFLGVQPEHVRTLRWAEEWLGEKSSGEIREDEDRAGR